MLSFQVEGQIYSMAAKRERRRDMQMKKAHSRPAVSIHPCFLFGCIDIFHHTLIFRCRKQQNTGKDNQENGNGRGLFGGGVLLMYTVNCSEKKVNCLHSSPFFASPPPVIPSRNVALR
ncbi:hypothetical protein L596_030845 [Steinernema carpocapsae]|uniref:Uncharacterized protein n=1 Tax=Steinernema carpocapsae TaxID=34508 RepID=A0A4U5LNB5_STECR|nr:hypothetical protein L596_030845 [Steinernema carpocapsae]